MFDEKGTVMYVLEPKFPARPCLQFLNLNKTQTLHTDDSYLMSVESKLCTIVCTK